jgi:hypothetical protein
MARGGEVSSRTLEGTTMSANVDGTVFESSKLVSWWRQMMAESDKVPPENEEHAERRRRMDEALAILDCDVTRDVSLMLTFCLIEASQGDGPDTVVETLQAMPGCQEVLPSFLRSIGFSVPVGNKATVSAHGSRGKDRGWLSGQASADALARLLNVSHLALDADHLCNFIETALSEKRPASADRTGPTLLEAFQMIHKKGQAHALVFFFSHMLACEVGPNKALEVMVGASEMAQHCLNEFFEYCELLADKSAKAEKGEEV